MAIETSDTELMNAEQAAFVKKQWRMHQHPDFLVDFDVSGFGDVILNNFLIQKGVWDPFRSSGGRFARFLVNHTYLFIGKTAIEIGSGTGLLGIVMAFFGAKRVVMSDVSTVARATTSAVSISTRSVMSGTETSLQISQKRQT